MGRDEARQALIAGELRLGEWVRGGVGVRRNLVPDCAKMGRILVSFCMKWDVISSHFLRFGTRLRPGLSGFRDEITSHLGVFGTEMRPVFGISGFRG